MRRSMMLLSLTLWMALVLAPVSLAFSQDTPTIASHIEQHNVPMLLIDPLSGLIVDANPAAERFYGYSLTQFRRMSIHNIDTFTAQGLLTDALLVASRQDHHSIFRHRLKSGEARTVEIYFSPVLEKNRTFLFCIIHDVTSRENSLAELARDEARLRHAEHVAGYGHWIFDIHSGMYSLSAGSQEIFGLEGERWSDEAIRSLFLAEYRLLMKNARGLLIEKGVPYNLQMRLVRASDNRLIDVRSQAVYDPEKRQIFGILEDVTDTAQAMRELEMQSLAKTRWMTLAILLQLIVIALLAWSSVRFRSAKQVLEERKAALRERSATIQLLLDSTAEAIYGLDLEGRCTFCNTASLRILGYERAEQLIGRTMHEQIHHSYANGTPMAITDCKVFNALQKQEGTHVDTEVFWRADGSSFPVEYWSYPVFKNDVIVGLVVTFLDITDRKQAERALQEKGAELERFTYTVSHDLKSPLVTIKAFLGLLKADMAAADHDSIEKDLHFLHSAADKMQRLLDELLEMARIGRAVNEPELIRFNKLIDEVMAVVSGRIVERGIVVDVSEVDVDLFGDRQRLAEIWQNLIDNAAKYMGEQSAPRIEIGVDAGENDPVFYVRDNGLGIEPQYHKKVFGLFDKLDPDSEGAGIGLALVKRIVELNEGQIWVESTGTGQGSSFRFTLPKVVRSRRNFET